MKITKTIKSATNTANIGALPSMDVEEIQDDKETITADNRDDSYIDELIVKVESKFPESVDGATWEYAEDEMYLTISIADTNQLIELTIPYDDLTMKNITADTNTIIMAIEDSVRKYNSRYEFIKTKSVPDSDGFVTDYTMYYDTKENKYVFVFGDRDIYTPEDGNFDWETESREEADEWFDNYNGFEDDVDDDDYLNDRW